MTIALSIIVPLAAQETHWRTLLPLLPISAEDEIIIAAGEEAPSDSEWTANMPAAAQVRWYCLPINAAANGRAARMNAAAREAKNDFLWFVHADSRPTAAALPLLRRALTAAPAALHYFPLRFYDGGWKMRLNEFGVFLRCRLFSNPFGDQALCLPKTLFNTLGGYDETAAYGEDHLLVLAAKKNGSAILPVRTAVATSARRYIQHGWWRTVCLYQKLWWRQWRQQ